MVENGNETEIEIKIKIDFSLEPKSAGSTSMAAGWLVS